MLPRYVCNVSVYTILYGTAYCVAAAPKTGTVTLAWPVVLLHMYDPPVSANNGIKFGAKESAPCLAGAAAGFAALQNTHGLFDRSPSDIAVSLQL
jgi:hypothetical protein